MSLGYVLLVLILYTLFVASLTRLVNYDRVLDPARLWVARRAARAHTAAQEAANADMATEYAAAMARFNRWNVLFDFLICPWCVSPWIGMACGYVPVHIIGWPWWTLFVVAWAARYLVGLADRWVSDPVEIVDEG